MSKIHQYSHLSNGSIIIISVERFVSPSLPWSADVTLPTGTYLTCAFIPHPIPFLNKYGI
jgi:hypothetical protein